MYFIETVIVLKVENNDHMDTVWLFILMIQWLLLWGLVRYECSAYCQSRGKIKVQIRNMVSVGCISLWHHRKVEKS